MKILLTLFLGLISLSYLSAQDSILSHTYTDDDMYSAMRFEDSIEVLMNKDGLLTIEEIIDSTNLPFKKYKKNQYGSPEGPFVIWSRLQLTNNGTKPNDSYFRLNTFIDSISVYTVKNGKIINEQFAGNSEEPLKKTLLTIFVNVPFSIDPGETKRYYFRLYYKNDYKTVEKEQSISLLNILPAEPLIHDRILNYSRQSFYAGMMILFSLVSLFMFGLFRERVFIYFAMLMFFFAAYFLVRYHILSVILNSIFLAKASLFAFITISGIVLSVTLFISRYIRLDKQFPKIYNWYLGFGFFVAFYPFPFYYLSNYHVSWIIQSHNYLLLVWIISCIIPVIILAKKGDKSARIILISIGILCVSAFVHILDLMFLIPSNIWSGYSFQIGTVLFSGIIFYGLFNKINTIRNEKERYEELDHMKSRFFANISHEFRTPLTLVMSPLQEVIEKQENPNDKRLLQMAHKNAGRLLQLINQLLDLSKLEAGKMNLITKEQNLSALLKGIVMSFESLASRKNIRLHFISKKEIIPMYVDKDKMEKIFYNILSNAFKFTPEQGEVSVMVTDQKKDVEIMIRDNGIGISSSRLPKIFNRFFQVDSSETRQHEGTGIGLALVKELIELHQGNIRVESKKGKGTTFFILLPKGKSHLNEIQIQNNISDTIVEEIFLHPEFTTPNISTDNTKTDILNKDRSSNDLPIVLIIEDNDDVRSYIKQHLDTTFQIMEAINGEEGIKNALDHLPDLIISDVMMPKKDGYEVCQTLKTDQRTSHIPIILLTAKAAQEEKLKGLETGADDYLIKPFNTKELEVRVRNLINSRIQLRQRFSENSAIDPQPISSNPVDNAFLEKVISSVTTHFSDEKYSVEILANEVGMSKAHLNRKLKALTDLSANKFIQSYRLEKALLFLQQKKGNVSEIAFQTGFNSIAYFVKCFREKYGKTPGVVLEE